MSEISARPRVRTVTAAQEGSLVSAAGVLLGAVAVAALSAAARAAVRACADSLAQTGPLGAVDAPAAVRAARPAAVRRAASLAAAGELPALDLAKAKALTSSLALPLAVAEPGAVRAAVERVAAASELSAVEAAGAELARVLDEQHTQVFGKVLLEACSQASVAAGFPRVEQSVRGDLARVVALDDVGHALVSEIRIDAAGVPAIETEALGWNGRGCDRALDRFDRALSERVVRSGATARRSTHGVAQLATAREVEDATERPHSPANRQRLGVPVRLTAGRGRGAS